MAFPNVTDSKKCQTLINVMARAVTDIRAARDKLASCRVSFTAANPSTTGTALDGNLAAINTWAGNVDAVADSAVASAILAAARPNHTEEY